MTCYLFRTCDIGAIDRWIAADGLGLTAKAGIGRYPAEAIRDLNDPGCEGVLGLPASRWPCYEVTEQPGGDWHVRNVAIGWTDFVNDINELERQFSVLAP